MTPEELTTKLAQARTAINEDGGVYSHRIRYLLIELYRESGMTRKEFCYEVGVSYQTFTYWFNSRGALG